MTRSRPPQRGQARTSRSNTLRISAAQVHLGSFLQHRSYRELMGILNAVAPPFEAKAIL
jgi:hypothetical protein